MDVSEAENQQQEDSVSKETAADQDRSARSALNHVDANNWGIKHQLQAFKTDNEDKRTASATFPRSRQVSTSSEVLEDGKTVDGELLISTASMENEDPLNTIEERNDAKLQHSSGLTRTSGSTFESSQASMNYQSIALNNLGEDVDVSLTGSSPEAVYENSSNQSDNQPTVPSTQNCSSRDSECGKHDFGMSSKLVSPLNVQSILLKIKDAKKQLEIGLCANKASHLWGKNATTKEKVSRVGRQPVEYGEDLFSESSLSSTNKKEKRPLDAANGSDEGTDHPKKSRSNLQKNVDARKKEASSKDKMHSHRQTERSPHTSVEESAVGVAGSLRQSELSRHDAVLHESGIYDTASNIALLQNSHTVEHDIAVKLSEMRQLSTLADHTKSHMESKRNPNRSAQPQSSGLMHLTNDPRLFQIAQKVSKSELSFDEALMLLRVQPEPSKIRDRLGSKVPRSRNWSEQRDPEPFAERNSVVPDSSILEENAGLCQSHEPLTVEVSREGRAIFSTQERPRAMDRFSSFTQVNCFFRLPTESQYGDVDCPDLWLEYCTAISRGDKAVAIQYAPC